MTPEIKKLCESLFKQVSHIPVERKNVLLKLSNAVQKSIADKQHAELLFVCTHNSRRSQFGQIWAAVAASYYRFKHVRTFSAGTEVTAVHPNVLQALRKQGFQLSHTDSEMDNPKYNVSFGVDLHLTCFSKHISDTENPSNGFTAVMTCSDAEVNCPIVPGAAQRIAITYEDPKVFDNTQNEMNGYIHCSEVIATEMIFVFSQITNP